MDYNLFEVIINKDERSKGEILQKSGISYTGYYGAIENKSVKVAFLEQFCKVTKTHISRFFEDWYVTGDKENIPPKVEEALPVYNKTFKDDFQLLLQSKDDLIAEQRARINELTDMISMFKSGKIRLAD